MVVDLHTHRVRVGHYESSKAGRHGRIQKKFAKRNRGKSMSVTQLPIIAIFYFLLSPHLDREHITFETYNITKLNKMSKLTSVLHNIC